MDSSLPGFSIHGIFQTRVLEWAAILAAVTIWSDYGAPKEAEGKEGLNYNPVLPPSPKVQGWV